MSRVAIQIRARQVVRTRHVVAAFKRAGFRKTGQTGSHMRLEHPDGRVVTLVEYGSRDYPTGTLRATLDDAGVGVAEFRRLSGKG